VTSDLEFAFEGRTVGVFAEQFDPRTAGRYRYMPYRGPGHYAFVKALAAGPVRCTVATAEGSFEFVVQSLPDYGVLQIALVMP